MKNEPCVITNKQNIDALWRETISRPPASLMAEVDTSRRQQDRAEGMQRLRQRLMATTSM